MITNNVVREVINVLLNDWLILLFIVDSNITVPEDFIFSLILSRITIVSFNEYPTIVKNAATVLNVISNPVNEKTPSVIMTS